VCWSQQAGSHQYRFSAFWLRSKCSICSYQLNIWYENHPSLIGLTLQCRQDRPTSPLNLSSLLEMFPNITRLSHCCSILLLPGRPGVVCLSEVETQFRYRPTDGRLGSGQSWRRFLFFCLSNTCKQPLAGSGHPEQLDSSRRGQNWGSDGAVWQVSRVGAENGAQTINWGWGHLERPTDCLQRPS